MLQLDRDTGNITDLESGMSLRDWFAGIAMQGMLIHHGVVSPKAPLGESKYISDDAYAMADAMIKIKRQTEKAK